MFHEDLQTVITWRIFRSHICDVQKLTRKGDLRLGRQWLLLDAFFRLSFSPGCRQRNIFWVAN